MYSHQKFIIVKEISITKEIRNPQSIFSSDSGKQPGVEHGLCSQQICVQILVLSLQVTGTQINHATPLSLSFHTFNVEFKCYPLLQHCCLKYRPDLTRGRPPQQAALLDFFLLLLCFEFNPQIIVSIEHFQVLRTICILELVFSKIITYYKLGL